VPEKAELGDPACAAEAMTSIASVATVMPNDLRFMTAAPIRAQ
jgi:hypothetical protein